MSNGKAAQKRVVSTHGDRKERPGHGGLQLIYGFVKQIAARPSLLNMRGSGCEWSVWSGAWHTTRIECHRIIHTHGRHVSACLLVERTDLVVHRKLVEGLDDRLERQASLSWASRGGRWQPGRREGRRAAPSLLFELHQRGSPTASP